MLFLSLLFSNLAKEKRNTLYFRQTTYSQCSHHCSQANSVCHVSHCAIELPVVNAKFTKHNIYSKESNMQNVILFKFRSLIILAH